MEEKTREPKSSKLPSSVRAVLSVLAVLVDLLTTFRPSPRTTVDYKLSKKELEFSREYAERGGAHTRGGDSTRESELRGRHHRYNTRPPRTDSRRSYGTQDAATALLLPWQCRRLSGTSVASLAAELESHAIHTLDNLCHDAPFKMGGHTRLQQSHTQV